MPAKQQHVEEPLTVTVGGAMRLSGLSHTKIYELLKAKQLEATHVGRRTLIHYPTLKRLLQSGSDLRRKPGRPRKVEPVAEPK
jgi:excisionase family DNA binding protein